MKNKISQVNNNLQNLGIQFSYTNDYEDAGLIVTLSPDFKKNYGHYHTSGIKENSQIYRINIILLNNRIISDQKLLENTFLHELGHFLGLKHPFDCNKGKYCNNNATKDNTLMAYKYGPNGLPNAEFKKMDLAAIKYVWEKNGWNDKYQCKSYNNRSVGYDINDHAILI